MVSACAGKSMTLAAVRKRSVTAARAGAPCKGFRSGLLGHRRAASADVVTTYNPRMRILVANDDGYLAPGLAALVKACEGLGELDVVAPEQNASGTSNSLTLNRPLSTFTSASGIRVVNGTPSDCVHIALTGLLDHRPDLV